MAEDNFQPASVPQMESHGRLMDTAERKAKMKKNIELAVLGVLCLAIIGFLIYQGTSSGKSPDVKVGPTVHQDTVVDSRQNEPDEAQSIHLVEGGTSNGNRDPFAPLIVAKERSAGNARVSFRSAPVLPPMHMSFGQNSGGLPPALPFTASSEPDPAAEFTVTGILRGNPSVAIIRDKNSGRHYVRVGDRIGQRLTVLSIEKGRVLLQAGGKNVVLTLGGNKDAS